MANVISFKRPSPTRRSMSNLARIDSEWMREAAKGLAVLDVVDREEFADWVAQVSQRLGTCEELALIFGVSPATYSRWMSGANLPPVYARQPIIDRLRELLLARAEVLGPIKGAKRK